ncbi:hypothetical protein SBADM41S_11551 [Streptomyces badius]
MSNEHAPGAVSRPVLDRLAGLTLARGFGNNPTYCHGDLACASTYYDLDVPFFTVDCDSGLLRGDFDEEIRSAARLTPRESALAAVRSFFARPADRDPLYLRYALAGSADDVWERREPATGPADHLTRPPRRARPAGTPCSATSSSAGRTPRPG